MYRNIGPFIIDIMKSSSYHLYPVLLRPVRKRKRKLSASEDDLDREGEKEGAGRPVFRFQLYEEVEGEFFCRLKFLPLT